MVADYLYEHGLNDELELAADSAANAVISNPNKPHRHYYHPHPGQLLDRNIRHSAPVDRIIIL